MGASMVGAARLSGFADRRRGLLLAGDLVALVVFAVIGRRSHEEATGLDAVASVLGTAMPFLLGWLAATLLVGMASEGGLPARSGGPAGTLRETGRTWVVAFPIAVVLRAAFLGRWSPLSFYVVAFLAPFALIAVWRVVFALVGGRLERAPSSGTGR
jgi:hypothetical protein